MLQKLIALTFFSAVASSQVHAQTDIQSIINRLEVKPINAGINPGFAGYEFTAIVLRGTNACEAMSHTPVLQARVEENYIHVTAFLNPIKASLPCNSSEKRYFSKVSTRIIFDSDKVTDTVIYNYRHFGNAVSLDHALADSTKAKIRSYSTQTVASSYPHQVDLIVTVSVMTGANPCTARNSHVSFEQQIIDGKLVVRAPLTTKPVACTMEYNPQFELRQFRLVAVKGRYSDIVLENVGDDGADVSLLSLLR